MKHFFMIVLVVFVTLINTGEAYSVNTENYTSSLGTNVVAFNYWSNDWVFIDTFPKSRQWVSSLCSGGWDNGPAMTKDSNGWVTSLVADQCIDTLILKDMNGHYPAGQYVILWEGDGKFTVFGDSDSVFDSEWAAITTSNGIKRSTFMVSNPTNSGISMKIRELQPGYLKNFRLIVPGGVCGSSSNNLDYFAYCQTSRGGTGSCSSGQTCFDFEQVYWDRFKDSTSTMNNPKAVFHPEFLRRLKKYRAIRYMNWMAITNSPLQHWSERADIKQQTYADANFTPGQQGKGIPYEFIVALSNILNTDTWLNIPAKSTDDYNTQFATFMKSNLAPNLKLYIEYTNEVFTYTSYVDDYNHMITMANSLGIPGGDTFFPSGIKVARYYSRRAGEIHSIWRGVFSSQPSRIIRALSTLNVDTAYTQEVLDYEDAYKDADVLAVNGYFTGNLYRYQYQPEILAITVDGIFTETNNGGAIVPGSQSALDELKGFYNALYALANTRGLRMVAYEGGQHYTANIFDGDGDTEEDGDPQNIIHNKFMAAGRDPRMKTVYLTNFTNFKNAGGHEFFHFLNLSDHTINGATFGALEHQTQSRTDAPKYDAIMTFMEQNPCWWSGCDRTPQPPPPPPVVQVPTITQLGTLILICVISVMMMFYARSPKKVTQRNQKGLAARITVDKSKTGGKGGWPPCRGF
ncbi:MAG: hypothetical protein HQL05_10080 [Nitrospirae bacterium]|uniref:hypothetical protein n=1 Tax=Candidatus Magnetobacterium casense TaxID=1455061 RepID=UPI00058F591F|nr:hypothetical protein [Candidatus Magnetobacterium casensis]MBF0338169.1 hypothetical protein [Nitrospirota bacterium]